MSDALLSMTATPCVPDAAVVCFGAGHVAIESTRAVGHCDSALTDRAEVRGTPDCVDTPVAGPVSDRLNAAGPGSVALPDTRLHAVLPKPSLLWRAAHERPDTHALPAPRPSQGEQVEQPRLRQRHHVAQHRRPAASA